MLSDYTMIQHWFDGPIKIACVADVHFGAIEHDLEAWEQFCKDVLKDEHLYLIFGGDLINNNTRSAVGSPWDDLIRPMEQKIRMVEYLEPLKNRILCGCIGNHEHRSMKDIDDDPLFDIFAKLNIEDRYRQNMAFMKIGLGKKYRDGRNRSMTTYVFAVTHGSGGGMTGAGVNRGEKFGGIIDGLDCLVMGHTHKPAVTNPAKIVIDTKNNMVTIKPFALVVAEPWQKYGSYPMQKMMAPTATGRPQVLTLDNREKHLKVEWMVI